MDRVTEGAAMFLIIETHIHLTMFNFGFSLHNFYFPVINKNY